MNKQPSKESLRERVKGIFGIGTTRPHSKQTESKPSELIITLDILMVRDAPTELSQHLLYFSMILCSSYNRSYPIVQELTPDCGLHHRIKVINHVCDLAKSKKFEEVRV